MVRGNKKADKHKRKGKNCKPKKVVKDIQGYKYALEIHPNGAIYRCEQTLISKKGTPYKYPKKLLKGSYSNHGYNCIMINAGGAYKRFYAHRLVAEAFIPNPKKLPFVDHKDFNRLNNSVDNLQWVTTKDNLKRSIENYRYNDLTYKDYRKIVVRFFCFNEQIKDIAKDYDVTATSISGILNGKNFRRFYNIFISDNKNCAHLVDKLVSKEKKSVGMKYTEIFG